MDPQVVVALVTVVVANITTVAITLIQQSATRRQLQAQSDAEAARWKEGDLSRGRERDEDRAHQRELDRLAAQRELDNIWRAERLEVDGVFLRAGRAYADAYEQLQRAFDFHFSAGEMDDDRAETIDDGPELPAEFDELSQDLTRAEEVVEEAASKVFLLSKRIVVEQAENFILTIEDARSWVGRRGRDGRPSLTPTNSLRSTLFGFQQAARQELGTAD